MRSPFVIEDLATTPRRHLFTLLGVPWMATPYAWVGVVGRILIGITIALMIIDESLGLRLLVGIIFGVGIEVAYFIHDIGHVIGGRIAGVPMNEALLTATRHINIYHGVQDYPSQVHILRALGGPLLNILAGSVALFLYGLAASPMVLFFAVANYAFGFGSLIPAASLDGEVILRELRRSRRQL